MSYIGSNLQTGDPTRTIAQPLDADRFSGNASTTSFTLSRRVGYPTDIEVFVENIQQEPITAYTVNGVTLTFTEAPPTGTNNVYVVYKQSTNNTQVTLADGSVTYAKLANNIRLFTSDNLTPNGNNSVFTLSEPPADANTVFVTVDGVVQRAPVHYTTSGSTITFTSSPPAGSNVHVRHLGFRTSTTVTAIPVGTYIPQPNIASPTITGTISGGPITVDASGNMGLGTATPSNFGGTNLQVQNSTIGSILWSNGTYTGQLLASASAEVTIGSRSNHVLRFGTNDTERMRIDTSGNVLLGTTSNTAAPTGYIAAANQFTFRNKLINGAMQVAQRATAATTVTLNGPGYTTVDRWFSYQNGTAGVQTSQVAPSLSQFQYCLKWGRPSTNTTTGTTVIGQALETVNSIELQNSTVTLSFWAKCGANFSAASSAIAVQMYTGTGADQSASLMVSGSWTGSATPINTSATLTTSWQRFVFTGTTGAGINQAGVYFNWSPTGTAGADDYVYITGLQLERGPVVTAYENRPYSTELALCQRYYLLIADGTLIGSGYLTNTLYLDFPIRWPVTMRGTPAVTKNGTWNVSGSNGQPTISLSGPSGCSVRITATATGQVYATLSGGSGSPSLSADIEL